LKDCGIYYVHPRNPISKYGLDKFVGLDPGVSWTPPTLSCFKSFRPSLPIMFLQEITSIRWFCIEYALEGGVYPLNAILFTCLVSYFLHYFGLSIDIIKAQSGTIMIMKWYVYWCNS